MIPLNIFNTSFMHSSFLVSSLNKSFFWMCICVQTCVHIHTHMYFDKSFIEIQSTYYKIHPDIYIWPDIFLALNWNSESRLMKSWFFVQLWKGRFFLWVTVPWARVPGLAGAAQVRFQSLLAPPASTLVPWHNLCSQLWWPFYFTFQSPLAPVYTFESSLSCIAPSWGLWQWVRHLGQWQGPLLV